MKHRERFNFRLQEHINTLLARHGDQYAYVREYVLQGGKQLRPMIFLEAVEAWGGEITTEVLDVACALELLHAFFLIHDDVMDGDMLRRNKPTLHAKFLQQNMQDGVGRAIVWGDVLYTECFYLLLAYPDTATARSLTQLIAEIAMTTADGQLMEANRQQLPSREELITFYEKKTALYSLFLPLQCAALITGRSGDFLQPLAKHAGIAYQLYDDYIEIVGEKCRREDGRCGDLVRLKATPLLLETLLHVSDQLREAVSRKFVEGSELTVDEEQQLLSAMQNGPLQHTLSSINLEANMALELMRNVGLEHTPTLTMFLRHYVQIVTAQPVQQ